MTFLEPRSLAADDISLLSQQNASAVSAPLAAAEVGSGLPGFMPFSGELGVLSGLDRMGAHGAIDQQDTTRAQEWVTRSLEPTTASIIRAPLSAPIRAVLAILQRWDISDSAAATVLGADGSIYLADLRDGAATLTTRDTKDRARLLLDIYEGVFTLLREAEAERQWIATPRQELDGQSVYDLMTEGSLRNLIRAQAFVDYVNGR